MEEWHDNTVWHHVSPCARLGADIGRRMVIIRLSQNSILVHNPAPLNTSLVDAIRKLGGVKCVTTVNESQDDCLSDWWLAFPNAYFFAAPGLDTKRTDIGFDGILNSTTAPLWRGQLFQSVLRGHYRHEDVVFCEPQSRTLLLGESLISLKNGNFRTQLLGMATGSYVKPSVPPFLRWAPSDKRRLRQSLNEILTWPFEHILPLHGDPIKGDGKRVLADAYHWVLNN